MPSVWPFSTVVGDAVDGLDDAVLGREVDLQVLDLEQRASSSVPHSRIEEGVDDVDDQVQRR